MFTAKSPARLIVRETGEAAKRSVLSPCGEIVFRAKPKTGCCVVLEKSCIIENYRLYRRSHCIYPSPFSTCNVSLCSLLFWAVLFVNAVMNEKLVECDLNLV